MWRARTRPRSERVMAIYLLFHFLRDFSAVFDGANENVAGFIGCLVR